MPLILSLETSGAVCSVAVHNESKVLATSEVHIQQSHASKLAVLIEGVLKTAGVENKELNAVAVSAGPGSYTGLRIGTSTAKGLCYSLDIPLISVGSLELLSFQATKFNNLGAWLCPMIDARRMEVYTMLSNADGKVIEPVAAKILDENSYAQYLSENTILFFGDGAEKFFRLINHPRAKFMQGVYTAASSLGVLASTKLEEGKIEDLMSFEPFYLKEFMIKQPKSLLKVL